MKWNKRACSEKKSLYKLENILWYNHIIQNIFQIFGARGSCSKFWKDDEKTIFFGSDTYFLEFSANNLGGWHWSWLIYGGGWLDISHFRFFFTDDLPFSHSSISRISRKNCEKYDVILTFLDHHTTQVAVERNEWSDQFHFYFWKSS